MYALNVQNSAAALVLPTELRHLTKHQYLLTYAIRARWPQIKASSTFFYQTNMPKEKVEPVCMLDK